MGAARWRCKFIANSFCDALGGSVKCSAECLLDWKVSEDGGRLAWREGRD
jgi:hypothetical protein